MSGHIAWPGHLAMLVYAVLVAGSFSVGALAAPHISPLSLTVARFMFAALLMGLVLVMISHRLPRKPVAIWRYGILGSLMGIFFVLMFVALRVSDPVSTGAVFTLIPLMSAAFGYLFLRQITSRTVAASLVVSALGAVWVIFQGDVERLLSFRVGRGEAIFFFGCVCQAAYAPLVRLYNRGESVAEFTFWTLALATVCLTAFGLSDVVTTSWQDLPAIVWWCIAYLTVGSTAITFFLLQYASMRLPSSKVFAYTYLIPSIVIALEGLLGHGWSGPFVVAGALVTVAGLVVLVLAPDG